MTTPVDEPVNSGACAMARRASSSFPDPCIYFCDCENEGNEVIVSKRQLQVAPVMKAFRDVYGYEPKRFRYIECQG